ncbi:Na+/H+ antiporter [Granulicella tundricola]|uniref:Na+/H+ antiporter n=1 Tax=Granulicella tundricola (strain ATCC BAA-1859 / DSM 23138 / MP5ACTX9) TaxID=1198114 RepID=E8X236_GRATM|nr:Na+/H+ antiporter [Granulicella tundricola]ADW70279.1 Na+/H+ antiporter [Granulicella tundricola MP5ACTX9]
MSPADNLHAFQLVFLLLLIFVAAFTLLARRLNIAYPIVLVVAGLLISFVPHIPVVPLNANLIFLIFLPPLLFSSAYATSWRELRANGLSIGFLAFGLVAFTVFAVAEFSDRFITALDFKSGFILGAVVAATDAIAATSIASSLGLPRRVVDILEGESLLNDATALLALEFGLQMLLDGTTPTVSHALVRLLWLTVAGSAIGFVIGFLVAKLNDVIDDGPIQIVISLITPYAAYLAGESVHASGVFAVVAAGLYISRQHATIFSPQVRIQLHSVWDALTFLLNGVVFALIGLQLPVIMGFMHPNYTWPQLLGYGAIFSLILIALRLIWVFPVAWIAHQIDLRISRHPNPTPNPKSVFIIGWTGMRGVISLAAAISLPQTLGDGRPFTTRSLILFLTFSVILVTLVLQGLTLPPLIRALKLSTPHRTDEEEYEARRTSLNAAIAYLEQDQASQGDRFAHIYEDLIHRYRHRLAAVGGPTEDDPNHRLDGATYERLRHIAAGAIHAERNTMITLRNQGHLSDEALRKMEHELDLQQSRYEAAND